MLNMQPLFRKKKKKIVNSYINVVDAFDLVGYGIVWRMWMWMLMTLMMIMMFLEDGDEALADDKFEEGGNLVDEGNDAGGHDGNGDMGDVTYDWHNIDYDDLARHGKWVNRVGFRSGQFGYRSIRLQGQK